MSSFRTDYASHSEISSQPTAWAELIPQVMAKAETVRAMFAGVDEVIFSGCGSGLNASLAGAPVMQARAGIAARAVPAADVYLFSDSVLREKRKTLAILSSRSGQTTEVIHALHRLHDRGIETIGITCTEGSPLAVESDLAFVLSPVVEKAVITTRSLTGMILVTQLIAAIAGQDDTYLGELKRLPAACEAAMQAFHEMGQQIGQRADLTHYAFLANSPLYGVAHESQLKIKEMVLLPSDCYPALDFRHGPQSNVDMHMLVTVFFSDSAGEEEARLLKDMKALGGVTWAICDKAVPGAADNADYLLEIGSGLDEYVRQILYMPAVQYMAYYRAIEAGLNPDEPHNLAYWIDTSN